MWVLDRALYTFNAVGCDSVGLMQSGCAFVVSSFLAVLFDCLQEFVTLVEVSSLILISVSRLRLKSDSLQSVTLSNIEADL